MLSIHKKRPVRKGVHQLSVLKPNAKVVKINDIDWADTLYISPKMVNPQSRGIGHFFTTFAGDLRYAGRNHS